MFCSRCNYDLRTLAAKTCPECGQPFDPADPSTFLPTPRSPLTRILKRIFFALAILVICGIVFSIWSVYRAAHHAILAEERLQATALVCDLIAEYVETSPTHSWPTSWAQLENLPARVRAMHQWPQSSTKVKAVVTIDFTLSTADVLKQTPQTCTAITLAPGPDFSRSPGVELTVLFDRLRAVASTPPPDTPGR